MILTESLSESLDDDLLELIDDDEIIETHQENSFWNVLVVDDDEEVHSVTSMALKNAKIQNRSLQLTHCYSRKECEALLVTRNDFAVVLLDVVMESDDAGLRLVEYIRNDNKNKEMRIILRTGQPGYAPELQIFQDYDINDYRTKSELTHTRLITSLISAIRSYEQLKTISESRRGLEMIVQATSDILKRSKMLHFAEGILTQISALLKLSHEGIVCIQKGNPLDSDNPDEWFVVGATGSLSQYVLKSYNEFAHPEISELLNRCKNEKRHLFLQNSTLLYIQSEQKVAVVYLAIQHELNDIDKQLVEVFASNIAASFGNLNLMERLHDMAYVDPLTELPNRNGFIQLLDELAESDTNGETQVVLIDLHDFSTLNDDIGSEAGDVLLVSFAQRLKMQLPKSTKIARIGSDVFGIILPHSIDFEDLDLWCSAPIAVGEHNVPLAVHIGHTHVLGHEQWGMVIFRKANIALHHAKLNPYFHRMTYTPQMDEDQHKRLEIVRQLRVAHENRQLQVWLQPQFRSEDLTVSGAEALLRWPSPNGVGFTYNPAEFIPLAESSGLIVEIGEWVLEESLDHLLHLKAQAGSPPRVAVNVSLMQFRQTGFAQMVIRKLEERGLLGEHLEIEITESMAMDEPHVVMATLKDLTEYGIRIAIDDFGTGYSSLAYLREIPHDCIKIDRAFIKEINGSEDNSMLAEHIVQLAHKLAKETVAEGVETDLQLEILKSIGCSDIQGFLLAKPMSLLNFEQWLLNRGAS